MNELLGDLVSQENQGARRRLSREDSRPTVLTSTREAQLLAFLYITFWRKKKDCFKRKDTYKLDDP